MQVELDKRELEIIEGMFDSVRDEHGRFSSEERELHEKVRAIKEQAEEFESIDLNDCAGGACKL